MRNSRGRIPNPNKRFISISDPEYINKCNNKRCYVCNNPASKYTKLFCICKESQCPSCSDGKPVNVPICDNPECITNLSDYFVPEKPIKDIPVSDSSDNSILGKGK